MSSGLPDNSACLKGLFEVLKARVIFLLPAGDTMERSRRLAWGSETISVGMVKPIYCPGVKLKISGRAKVISKVSLASCLRLISRARIDSTERLNFRLGFLKHARECLQG